MEIMQVITDYIRRSVLTTQGDLLVRGAALPDRLAAVAAGKVLSSEGVGTEPSWDVPRLSDNGMDIGSFTRSTAGNEDISLSFTPSFVLAVAADLTDAAARNWSVGFSDGSSNGSLYWEQSGGDVGCDSVSLVRIYEDASNYILGSGAFSSSQLRISFTLSGARTAKVTWCAIG